MSEFQQQITFVQALRPYADCSDVVWASVIGEIETVGMRRVSKSATNLLMITQEKAARAGVLKHPGHADQAGHGNGGKTPKSAGNVAAGLAIEARYKESNDDYSKGAAKGAAIINRTQNMNEAKVMMTDMSRMISAQYQGVPDAKSKSFGVLAGMKETFDARFMMGMEGS